MTFKEFEYLKKFHKFENGLWFQRFFAKNWKFWQIREQFTNSRNVCELEIIVTLKNVNGLKKNYELKIGNSKKKFAHLEEHEELKKRQKGK